MINRVCCQGLRRCRRAACARLGPTGQAQVSLTGLLSRDLMVVGEGARAVMCVDWARRSHSERHMQLVPGGDLPDRIRCMSIRAIHSHVQHAAVQARLGTSQALQLLGASTRGRHVERRSPDPTFEISRN